MLNPVRTNIISLGMEVQTLSAWWKICGGRVARQPNLIPETKLSGVNGDGGNFIVSDEQTTSKIVTISG